METAHKRRIAVLVSVIAIVAISYAAIMRLNVCKQTLRESSEAVLRQNLDTLRKTIDGYTYEESKAPQSLQDLVTAGYLRKIPTDPITGKADWEAVSEDTMVSIDQAEPGINDVHSASDEISTKGTSYNTW